MFLILKVGLNFPKGTVWSIEDGSMVLVSTLSVTTIADGISNHMFQMYPISHHGK